MKLKYYLRGLGIGIIVTTIVLAISFSQREVELSDEEIIARATQLGMVMQEEDTDTQDTEDTGQTTQTKQEDDIAGADDVPQVQDEIVAPETEVEQNITDRPVDVTEEQPTDTAETEAGLPADTTAAADGLPADETTAQQGAGESYRLIIKKGDVCRVVCENLAANGIISDAEAFRKYLFEIGYASNMSVGEYDIPYGLTQEEVAEILKAGPIEE